MRGRVDPGVRLALLALAWLGACAVQFAQPALWPAGVYVGITLLALPIAIVGRRQVGWSALAVALLAFGSTGWRTTAWPTGCPPRSRAATCGSPA